MPFLTHSTIERYFEGQLVSTEVIEVWEKTEEELLQEKQEELLRIYNEIQSLQNNI